MPMMGRIKVGMATGVLGQHGIFKRRDLQKRNPTKLEITVLWDGGNEEHNPLRNID